MSAVADQIINPRILVVDDERQIHASLRLRLAANHEVVCCADPRVALAHVKQESFDLCFVDLHMPAMTGLQFVEAARTIDAGLGFVILSGHGTEENLRRAIPLQVYDFILKPLPDRAGFEQRLPEWISRTKARRKEMALLESSATLVQDLGTAQIERDIEFTASESARDALLQSANLLTTIHALVASACQSIDSREKQDAGLRMIGRSLHEARRATEAATTITESFFDSAYANRDASLAILGAGLRQASEICLRWTRSEHDRKNVDSVVQESNAIVRGLSGIELLLLLIPPLSAALEVSAPGTTVQVRSEGCLRLDAVPRALHTREFLWVNRRNAMHSHPGVLLGIRSSAGALDRAELTAWLEARPCRINLPVRGLLHGLAKCKGMMGFSVAPTHGYFEIVLALPT